MTDWPSNPHESAPGIRFCVDPLGVVRTTLSGTIAYAQLVMHVQARERAGVLGRPQIIDAREARMELTCADARALAVLIREHRHDMRVGPTAVVAEYDLAYGIARMYGGFDDSERFAVFRSMAEAEAWIAGRA